jgi:uncharacterized protein (DUF362 family)
MKMKVATVEFQNYTQSVAKALDGIGAATTLAGEKRIILKPNVITDSPPPVTTPAACVEAVLDYCRANSAADIVIAEGCGALDTLEAFEKLGYTDLARRKDIQLIDLDRETTVRLENASLEYLPEFHMPRCLADGFLISIPVLKAHSMSKVTLTLKNMVGIAPAEHYCASSYRKSALHGRNNRELHRYIVELNQYRKPDLTVMDATVGMAESHLWGKPCTPPVNKILASFDPVAVDAAGTRLLGFDWRKIDHIRLANGLLGTVEEPPGG